MSNHTTSNDQIPAGYRRCSSGDNCLHPDGPILPATVEYFHPAQKWLRRHCRVCEYSKRRERKAKNPEIYKASRTRHREKHADELRAKRQEWREKHPDKVKWQTKDYYERNKDKRREAKKQWREANKDRINAHRREWKKANRELVRLKSQARRAKERNAPGSYTIEDLREIMTLQHGKCLYCGRDLNEGYSVDHFMPLHHGGTNSKDNIVLCCKSDNSSKGAKMPWNWYRWNGAYPVFHTGRLL